MAQPNFVVAVNLFKGPTQMIAAAVIYAGTVEEPSFSYVLNGRSRIAFLYRRGDRVPPGLDAALNAHIKETASSWALVTAHLDCPPETALALAIVRAVERWVCRRETFPSLAETHVLLPGRRLLGTLPPGLQQVIKVKDWHTASARALCRYYATQET